QAADDTRTAVTTSEKSSFVMAPWTRRSAEKLLAAGSGAGFHFARDARALDHDEARGRNVPLNRARCPKVDLFDRLDIAGDGAADGDRLTEQIGLYRRPLADRQVVIPDLDGTFDVAVDRQIFAADHFPLDAHRRADPCGDASLGRGRFRL